MGWRDCSTGGQIIEQDYILRASSTSTASCSCAVTLVGQVVGGRQPHLHASTNFCALRHGATRTRRLLGQSVLLNDRFNNECVCVGSLRHACSVSTCFLAPTPRLVGGSCLKLVVKTPGQQEAQTVCGLWSHFHDSTVAHSAALPPRSAVARRKHPVDSLPLGAATEGRDNDRRHTMRH